MDGFLHGAYTCVQLIGGGNTLAYDGSSTFNLFNVELVFV